MRTIKDVSEMKRIVENCIQMYLSELNSTNVQEQRKEERSKCKVATRTENARFKIAVNMSKLRLHVWMLMLTSMFGKLIRAYSVSLIMLSYHLLFQSSRIKAN